MLITVFYVIIGTLALPPDTVWSRCYGGIDYDEGRCVIQLPDGGFALAGRTRSFGTGESDIYVIRTGPQGDTVWTRTYGTAFNDGGASLALTADSCLMTAYTSAYESGNPDINLVKLDQSGNTVFTKTIGSMSQEGSYCIRATPDSGFIIAGYRSGNLYLVKTTDQGDTVWTRSFGGGSTDAAYYVISTPESGYVACGYTRSFGAGGADAYIIKTDAAGNELWTSVLGGTYDEIAWSVQPAGDDGYLIAGETWSFGEGAPVYPNVFLVKLDSTGDSVWTRVYGGPLGEGAISAALTSDGQCVVTGYVESWGAGNSDLWLAKVDQTGDTIWTSTVGGPGFDKGASIIQTADRGFACTGSTESFGSGSADLWLLKFESDTLAVVTAGTLREPSRGLNIYPNPFRRSILIGADKTAARRSGDRTVRIYDRSGRRVKEVPAVCGREGALTAIWNGDDAHGAQVANGVYFICFGMLTRPVILVK